METSIIPSLISARKASRKLSALTDQQRNSLLIKVADAIEANMAEIIDANRRDLARMNPDDPKYDRLKLTEERLKGIASDTRNVASLPSPLIEIERRVLPNGLEVVKQAVPFGVIGVIYEARPNVSVDVFSLCFKAGNAAVLKGGSDAADSNRAIVDIISNCLATEGVDSNCVVLLPATREATSELLEARGYVDLIIPRGSRGLIDFVRAHAKIPVIETGAGVCHCYIESSADTAMASAIVNNAKTRRVSVCNSLDCVLIDSKDTARLAEIFRPLVKSNVVVYADDICYEALNGNYPAELLRKGGDEEFGTEFLDYAMAVHAVSGIEEAIDHIDRYGSGHSESIVTANEASAQRFRREVDAACVYVNAPTSFTDGAQFGLGAEIGISTQKLHARGPMALREITTYKWLVTGNGQTRP